jgi:hypothetical protein
MCQAAPSHLPQNVFVRLPATLAGIELRQSRFDHFKVSVQLILGHARQRGLPLYLRYPYIEASLGRQEFVLGSDYRRLSRIRSARDCPDDCGTVYNAIWSCSIEGRPV